MNVPPNRLSIHAIVLAITMSCLSNCSDLPEKATGHSDSKPIATVDCPDYSVSPKRGLLERLAVARDPEVGTLAGRIEGQRDTYDEDLCGTIIEPPPPPFAFTGRLGRYEEFTKDMDLTFTLRPDFSTQTRLNLWFSYPPTTLECELVPYAREVLHDGILSPVFPGWREDGCWSVQFDGTPFWTGTYKRAAERWEQLQVGSHVCVRGAIVKDRRKQTDQYEVHPVYSIRVLAN